MNVHDVLALIDDQQQHSAEVYARLKRDAPISSLVAALRLSDLPSDTRRVVIEVLGFRRSKRAEPLLVMALDDADPGVRNAAADSLGKIGSPAAGPALMRRLVKEHDRSLRHWLVASLGAVGYQPAAPILIELLSDVDPVLRHMAARSLGRLKASEAQQAIENAIEHETDDFPRSALMETMRILRSLSESRSA